MPRKRDFSRDFAAFWRAHASIFDAGPRLAFQILPMPINTASLERKRGEQRELGFLSLGLILGFLLFLYFSLFYSSCSRAEIDSEERKKDIVLE